MVHFAHCYCLQTKSEPSFGKNKNQHLLIVVTLDSKLTENTKLISEIFSQWRDSLSKDSFTDLKILCKDDWYSGISLHKAVLASISPFMVRVHHMFSRIL